MSTQLPMIECTACGKIMGHLYNDYYAACLILENHHDDLITNESIPDLSTEFSTAMNNGTNIWDKYLKIFYETLHTLPSEDKENEIKLFTPKSLVCNALLYHRNLTPDDLPLHKNTRAQGCVRYCCLRMLQCDNSQASY